MVFSGGLAISKLRAAAGQSSAARLLWRAGCAVVFFGSPKNEGEQSADRRWCGTPHPVARLAVEPISGSPEITGGIRPPPRLFGALLRRFPCGGGPRFLQRFSRRRQPAPGRGPAYLPPAPRRPPRARLRTP